MTGDAWDHLMEKLVAARRRASDARKVEFEMQEALNGAVADRHAADAEVSRLGKEASVLIEAEVNRRLANP